MRILFVCTGNTCRSPMAQGLAKSLLSDKFEIASAGIQAFDKAKVSENAVIALQEKGIDISDHQAERLTWEMMAESDQVLTMTKAQKILLVEIYPEFKDKIHCLGHSEDENMDICDPWGNGVEVYRQCAKQIEQLLERLAIKWDEN